MISGANEEELDIANARADLLLEIQKLKQENEELKEALENKKMCYYNNKAYDIKVLLNKNNILTEFEKWLEEKIKTVGGKYKDNDFADGYLKALQLSTYELQELKGSSNEKGDD